MKIALVGDIALFGCNSTSNPKWKEKFASVKTILEECDYVIGNLESPLTNNNRTIGGKSAYLKGRPEDVEILKVLGVTHVSLANNHMFDYCIQGMEDTIRLLENSGIKWFGANNKTETIADGNNRVCLAGYCCYSTNGKGLGKDTPCINIFDPRKAKEMIDECAKEGLLPIISVHWGQEHVHYPNYDHVETARKLCKVKKVIIHGHHPHVIQGIEKAGDSLIAYSLGNFCFDDVYTEKSKDPLIKLSKDNQESFILIVELNDNAITSYKIIPFSFEGGNYRIDMSLSGKIDEWSAFLNTPKPDYNLKRRKDLSDYLENRKKLRNFEWYIKRLNPESIKMILAARNNAKNYSALVKSFISEQESTGKRL